VLEFEQFKLEIEDLAKELGEIGGFTLTSPD
jgi:hypothetical protein